MEVRTPLKDLGTQAGIIGMLTIVLIVGFIPAIALGIWVLIFGKPGPRRRLLGKSMTKSNGYTDEEFPPDSIEHEVNYAFPE